MAGIASSSSSSSEDLSTVLDQPEPVDFLLQKRKCELMYELKNLEHGEKPVTGSDSRGKVNNFFSKRLHLQEIAAPVANTDDVEEHRPQQVTIEVQGLLQSRSVSSLLRSQHFRRSLESAVRSHLSSSSSPIQRTRATSNVSAATSTVAAASTAAPVPSVVTPPPPVTSTAPSPPSVTSTVPRPPPLSSMRVESESTSRLPDPSHNDSLPVSILEDRIQNWNHDDFVMEISELVHRQIVSSALHSPFRNRLERHVMARVVDSGTDGQAVQEQILNLPVSNIRRNDFSHLGIPSAHDQQLDDAVSVISATASASIPYAQSNTAVQREMCAMKAQISKLSDMLKMSLDLQMDIQRSIRQEVAAAISQATSAPPANSTVHRSRRANEGKCIICLEGEADAVFYRCGHLCTCYTCALRMKGDSGNCPVCRAPISDILRAYKVSHDY